MPERSEAKRVSAVEPLQARGDFADVHFQNTCRLAARLFRAPIAFVSLVGADTTWIKAAVGLECTEVPRKTTLCDATVQLAVGEVLLMPDLARNRRRATNPNVTGTPQVRFYAGVPIAGRDGLNLGTFCILDVVARPDFADEEIAQLTDFGRVVGDQLRSMEAALEHDAQLFQLERVHAAAAERHESAQRVAESAAGYGRWRVNVEQRNITWSPGVARIFGQPMPPSGTVPLDVHMSYYHPDDATRVRRRMMDSMAGHSVQEDGSYSNGGRILRPDGEVRELIIQGAVERDETGKVCSLSGIVVDVTDILRSQRLAQDKGDLLRLTLESMSQGLIMLGADERVRICNQRVRDMFDFSEEILHEGSEYKLVRDTLLARGDFDDTVDAPLREWAKTGFLEREPATYERKRPNGTSVEIRAMPLLDGGVVRTYTDITQRKSIEAAVRESQHRFQLLAENTTDIIIWTDLDTTRRYVSPAVRAVLGYEPEELVGTKPLAFLHPDDVSANPLLLEAGHGEVIERGTTCQRYRHKNGTWVWIEASFSLTRQPETGCPLGYVVSLRDISDRKRIEDALRLSEERLALALESGSDGFWDCDLATREVSYVGRWPKILGYEDGEMTTSIDSWKEALHPDDRERTIALFAEHLVGGSTAFEGEYRVRTKAGTYIWAHARGKVVSRDEAGRATRIIGTHFDVSKRKEAENLIAHMAVHDALTGLPNRVLFKNRLHQELSAIERQGGRFAVLACDLDRFKYVNDTLGHSAGDKLLQMIARRLEPVMDTDSTIARLGGDEFAVIVGRLQSPEDASRMAERLIKAMEQPFEVEGHPVAIGMSVGIAIGPDDGPGGEQLYKNADIALYRAKAAGRNTCRFFEHGMDTLLAERNVLEQDLGEAVKRAEFELHYQPILDLASGHIDGFEALLRWRHPTRGTIFPIEFVPLAEENGLIVPLGEWVLQEACRQAAEWPEGLVAVNISAVQFQRPDALRRSVFMALAASGLPPDRLELEITESVLMQDVETSLACLQRLRDLGVRIALDDFGTGYSGLNYLRRFPFHKIKIDRSFVHEIEDTGTTAIIRAVVGLAKRVGAAVTAEGVETEQQLQHVREAGCTEVQGFLFSKALSAADATDLIRRMQQHVAA